MLSEAVIERLWRWGLSEHRDALGSRNGVSLEIHLEAEVKWLRDALWGRDRASLEMQVRTEIEWTQRYTLRLSLCVFGDALGGYDWASMDMHLEAEIQWTQRCTLRLWPSKCGDALVAGDDQARLEECLEVVDLEVVDGRHANSNDSIHRVVHSKPWECDEVTLPWKLLRSACWWRWMGREVQRELKLNSELNSKLWEWRNNRQS